MEAQCRSSTKKQYTIESIVGGSSRDENGCRFEQQTPRHEDRVDPLVSGITAIGAR